MNNEQKLKEQKELLNTIFLKWSEDHKEKKTIKVYKFIRFDKSSPNGHIGYLECYFSKEEAVEAKNRELERRTKPSDSDSFLEGKSVEDFFGPLKIKIVSFEVELED